MERVSNARTIAPILLACAQAAKPATPPPITRFHYDDKRTFVDLIRAM